MRNRVIKELSDYYDECSEYNIPVCKDFWRELNKRWFAHINFSNAVRGLVRVVRKEVGLWIK